MDIGSISSAVTSLKAATDIAQAMAQLKSLSDVQSKVLDLQAQILAAQSSALDAQSEQFDLRKRIGELEVELARLRTWEKEKERYALIEVSSGVFVRELKAEHRESEPKHWLCCNCFDKGEKSLLQLEYDSVAAKSYSCQRCDGSIKVANPDFKPPGPRGGPNSWKTA